MSVSREGVSTVWEARTFCTAAILLTVGVVSGELGVGGVGWLVVTGELGVGEVG